MSFSPNSRAYRPIRSRRQSSNNQSDGPKRYKLDEPIGIMGPMHSFDQHNEPDRMEMESGATSADHDNNVVLFTVINAAYPITVDVMKAICTPFGKVLRIVVFRKNGVQALVEFDSITAARHAKDKLQGADIYSGCCTLKVDYAKSKRLNVMRNDADNYDSELGDADANSDKKPLLRTPAGSNVDAGNFQSNNMSSGAPPLMEHAPRLPRPSYRAQMPDSRSYMSSPYNQYREHGYEGLPPYPPPFRHEAPSLGQSYHSPGSSRGPLMSHQAAPYQQMDSPYPIMHSRSNRGGHYQNSPANVHGNSIRGAPPMHPMSSAQYNNDQGVLLVNNLNLSKMNCEMLFNFLCVYGNVHRIKFLHSREGCAMVQMNQMEALGVFLRHINNTYVFGNKISISFSKQEQLEPVMRPYTLADGSPSYMDYSETRNNRYLDERAASKNRPVAPSNTLYYFNTPPDYVEEDVCKIFDSVGGIRPLKIKNFATRRSYEDNKTRGKGVTGLAEWNNIADAADTLVLANNYLINHASSRWPYVFKLTFSSAPVPVGSFNPLQSSDNPDGIMPGNNEASGNWNANDHGEEGAMRRQSQQNRGSSRWNRSISPKSSKRQENKSFGDESRNHHGKTDASNPESITNAEPANHSDSSTSGNSAGLIKTPSSTTTSSIQAELKDSKENNETQDERNQS